MEYQDALREWGARRLEADGYPRTRSRVVRATVQVEMCFSEGFSCCAGYDPECYCSLAQSPSASVQVMGSTSSGSRVFWSMPVAEFDFVTVLRELVEVGDGSLTD